MSHQLRLYHAGARPVHRSTLADANAIGPWQVFAELFTEMVRQGHRGLRRATQDAVRLVDSTGPRLCRSRGDWGKFSACVRRAKVDGIYDADAGRPLYFARSPANLNDS